MQNGNHVTKQSLITLRESTYQAPDLSKPRCETCEHYWDMVEPSCQLIRSLRGVVNFPVHPFGWCELWEAKEV